MRVHNKNNWRKILDELQEVGQIPLEHMFYNHEHCSSEWCLKTRATEEWNVHHGNWDEPIAKEVTNRFTTF